MKKFVVVMSIPQATIQEWMQRTDAEARNKQTEEMKQAWGVWMQQHAGAVVEQGLPLGKTLRVTKDHIEHTRNDHVWYLVVRAASQEDAATMVKQHPHLQIPNAYADVMDASGMGM
jgi:hypothetical protein